MIDGCWFVLQSERIRRGFLLACQPAAEKPYRPRTLFSFRLSGALCLAALTVLDVILSPLGLAFADGIGFSSGFPDDVSRAAFGDLSLIFGKDEVALLGVARGGTGLGGLRRGTVVCAGGECEDCDEGEQCGDVFHTQINRR